LACLQTPAGFGGRRRDMHGQIGPHPGDTAVRKVRCVEAEPVRELAGLRQEQEGEAELGGGDNGTTAAWLSSAAAARRGKRAKCGEEERSRLCCRFWRPVGVVGATGARSERRRPMYEHTVTSLYSRSGRARARLS
jgi:hypothetical protein